MMPVDFLDAVLPQTSNLLKNKAKKTASVKLNKTGFVCICV